MNWSLFFVIFFTSTLIPALILLLGSMHLFSLFLRRVTIPSPPTIALLLSLWLLLRFSKLCSTPISSKISNLTIFFQITSLASTRQNLQGFFFPVLLIPGHPLLGTSEKHSSSLLISLRHLTESGISLWYPNFQLMTLLLSSANSFLAYYPITLYLLLLTTQPLHPSRLQWCPQVSVHSPTPFLLFINDLHVSASDVHSSADDSTLHKSSSFQSQLSSNARFQSRLTVFDY